MKISLPLTHSSTGKKGAAEGTCGACGGCTSAIYMWQNCQIVTTGKTKALTLFYFRRVTAHVFVLWTFQV